MPPHLQHNNPFLLQSIVAHLPMVVFVFDITTNTNVYSNHHMLADLGYDEEALSAMGADVLAQIIHPKDFAEVPAILDAMAKLKAGEQFVHMNRWLRKHDGQYAWYRNTVVPFAFNDAGQVTQVLGMSREVTVLMNNRENLVTQVMQMEKTSFLVSHELRHEHAKILAIINDSHGETEGADELGRLQVLSRALRKSALQMDQSIKDLAIQLDSIKQALGRLDFGLEMVA